MLRRTRIRGRSIPKTDRAKLERRLDVLNGLYVRLKWPRCWTCPATTDLQRAHVFSGGGKELRWSLSGGVVVQCPACNSRHEHDTKPLYDAYIKAYGQPAFEMLEVRSRKVRTWTLDELEQLEARMEKEILHMWRTAEVYNLRPADMPILEELRVKEESNALPAE